MKSLLFFFFENFFWFTLPAIALGLIGFPVYALWFAYHLIKRRYDRLHHLTMMLFILVFICAIFTIMFYFFKFSAKGIQSEAKCNLGAIFTAQVAYYGEYSTYAKGKDCFELLGWAPEKHCFVLSLWAPEGETIYTYHCDGDFIAPTKPGVAVEEVPADFNLDDFSRPRSTQTSFTVMAVGNIDWDSYPDVWIMPDSKNLSNVMNDFGNGEDADRAKAKAPVRKIVYYYLSRYREEDVCALVLCFLTPLLLISILRDRRVDRRRAQAKTPT